MAQPDRTWANHAVIYFGNDWAAENRTSSHHIARNLSQRCKVLYVEVPGLRAPKASGRDIRKLFRKLQLAFQQPRIVGEQMWCMTMPQIPFRRLAAIRKLNLLLGRHMVKRAVRKLGLVRTISWFVVPHAGALAGGLGEELVVYYCIDDYAALPDVDRTEVSRMDEDLTRRADQVFVASATLLASKHKLNRSLAHSPHGVDIELFQQASSEALEVADAAQNLTHPVIGFFGLIEAWIDLELIEFLAWSRPSWTFLLIGRVAVDVGALAKLPNVVLAGPQPYESLARWAKAFDVAIIPYRLTEQVLHANPLKLREYLATGKPVVSVSTPEIDQFAEHVQIADSREKFLGALDRALTCDSQDARERRMRAVAKMGWDCRVEEVLGIVKRNLNGRIA